MSSCIAVSRAVEVVLIVHSTQSPSSHMRSVCILEFPFLLFFSSNLYQTRAMNFQGNQVITADGIVVTAGAVVMATNSPLNHNLAIHARQTPDHSYVVGLKLPKESVR